MKHIGLKKQMMPIIVTIVLMLDNVAYANIQCVDIFYNTTNITSRPGIVEVLNCIGMSCVKKLAVKISQKLVDLDEYLSSQIGNLNKSEKDNFFEFENLVDLFVLSQRVDFRTAGFERIAKLQASDKVKFLKHVKNALKNDSSALVRSTALKAVIELDSLQLLEIFNVAVSDSSSQVTDLLVKSLQSRSDSVSLQFIHDILLHRLRGRIGDDVRSGISVTEVDKEISTKFLAVQALRYRPDSGQLLLDAYNNWWTNSSGAPLHYFWENIAQSLILHQDVAVKSSVQKIMLFNEVKTRIGTLGTVTSTYTIHLTEYLNRFYFADSKNVDIKFIKHEMIPRIKNLVEGDYFSNLSYGLGIALKPMVQWLQSQSPMNPEIAEIKEQLKKILGNKVNASYFTKSEKDTERIATAENSYLSLWRDLK